MHPGLRNVREDVHRGEDLGGFVQRSNGISAVTGRKLLDCDNAIAAEEACVSGDSLLSDYLPGRLWTRRIISGDDRNRWKGCVVFGIAIVTAGYVTMHMVTSIYPETPESPKRYWRVSCNHKNASFIYNRLVGKCGTCAFD